MLATLLRDRGLHLTFTSLEIGAVPISSEPERCHRLLADYPGSRVFAFEVDPALCARLNERAAPGLRFFPYALGAQDEERPFYETAHPMCASLYRPDESLLGLYHNLEVARLVKETTIRTHRLDDVARRHDIGAVDFIKIDVQGAELDVFRGGAAVLPEVLAIVSEVEFVPLYERQPLFGDVCAFLHERGLLFHKFLGVAGRALRPVLVQRDPNFAVQHLWADAIFLRDPRQLGALSVSKLLKLAVLADLHGSPDVACGALLEVERRGGAALAQDYVRTVST